MLGWAGLRGLRQVAEPSSSKQGAHGSVAHPLGHIPALNAENEPPGASIYR